MVIKWGRTAGFFLLSWGGAPLAGQNRAGAPPAEYSPDGLVPSAAKQGFSERDVADWSQGCVLWIISHGMLLAADIWVGDCRPQICRAALWGTRLLSGVLSLS